MAQQTKQSKYGTPYKVASGCGDNTIKILNVNSGMVVKTLTDHNGIVNCIQILPDGSIASGSEDQTIKIWDIEKEKPVHTLIGHRGSIFSLVVLPRGQLASGSADTTIKIWNRHTGELLSTLSRHKRTVTGLAILSNGYLDSSAVSEATISFWDTKHNAYLHILDSCEGNVFIMSILANGCLVGASGDKKIRIWNTKQLE